MLEHSAMYLNVTPPYEDDASFFPDFYTRLGPCELQDPVWAKMSALTVVKQKRKKAENKPQTQINKCNNEKRRREQENIYIEELAELISANFADMSSFSVKPDKCAILQETVNQIRRIKQQDNSNRPIADPVQQGEVSSSRPTILSNEVYGPLLLEALEGFLFVVNGEGKVEHVTENVSNYIKYTKDDVIGKSIYNFMHPGDHTKFHSNLLPMTIEWGNDQPAAPARSKSIDVRLLVKPPDDLDETVEEKRQRVTCYELMHISSTQLRDHLSVSEDDGSDSGPCLLCVASRISHREKNCSFEQFTTKLDASGKIICVDTSGVSESVSQALRKDFKGRVLRDLVPAQDAPKVTAHLKETLNAGTSISSVYRIQVTADKFVQVQTKSKFFKTNPHANSDTDFIMATHSIINDNETLGPGDPGGGGGGGIGGPLMTSVVNGAGPSPRNVPSAGGDAAPPPSSAAGGAMLPAAPTSAAFAPGYLDSDFSIDFPTTTWPDLEAGWPEAARPDSRQSVTPVSTPTPRPPSNPSYSNAPTMVQSPLPHFPGQQQSPANQSQNSGGGGGGGGGFNPFGLIEDYPEQNCYHVEEPKDTKTNVLNDAASLADSHRLRILLTNPPTSSASNAGAGSQQDENRDRILKELLNQQDDDQGNRGVARGGPMGRAATATAAQEPPKGGSTSTGNNMLRQLLNDKGDDDDIEAKAGMKKRSELLQQLLKKDADEDDDKKNDGGGGGGPQEDTLLRSLGFPPGSPNGDRRGSKRSMDDKEDRDSKRSGDGSQVSSSASSSSSELCKKNKMLASLLAKQTPAPPSIPPIPASEISATPHEKLPRIVPDPAAKSTAQSAASRSGATGRLLGRHQQAGGGFLARDAQRHASQATSCFAGQAAALASDNNNWGENNNNNNNLLHANVPDPILSDILDQVIDFVPDDIMQILDIGEGPQTNNFQGGLSEMAAINIIQKSLMQCESAVKGPAASPNVSLPARPPAYSANATSQNSLGYPPPPNYPQAKYQRTLGARGGGGAGPQYASANVATQQQLLLAHQRKQLQQQQVQEHKQRLLQQQKQQQLLIPSNATAEINSIQNIDSLLNNAVAPNVSLQRSNSVPESQLSPNYGAQLQGSNALSQTSQRTVVASQPQQQPYSPHAQQNFQTQAAAGNYGQQGARLSPQSQFNAQLSPRQAYPQAGGGAAAAWTQQRMTVQQNPMLNAQLTGSPLTGGRNFQRPPVQQQQQQQQQQQPSQQQQQRTSLNSPGVPGGARHSPFAADQFPPPASPNSAFATQTQYLQRLQRANSAPSTTAQMTGGLGSPRPYSGNQAPPHYPPNPLQSIPPAPMLYAQQPDAYCYDHPQPGLGYEQRRAGGPPHLQPGVAGSNPTSEFVRQELRAVVGARTGQVQPPAAPQRTGQQLQLGQQQSVDLEALGISFEMPSDYYGGRTAR